MPNGVKGGHGTAGDELIKLDDESAKEFAALIGSGGGAVDVCDLKKEVTDASGNKELLFPFQDQIEGAWLDTGTPELRGTTTNRPAHCPYPLVFMLGALTDRIPQHLNGLPFSTTTDTWKLLTVGVFCVIAGARLCLMVACFCRPGQRPSPRHVPIRRRHSRAARRQLDACICAAIHFFYTRHIGVGTPSIPITKDRTLAVEKFASQNMWAQFPILSGF